jgi:hypothetical protein
MSLRNFDRPAAALSAIVLPIDAGARKKLARLTDAAGERLRLIEARHQDRELDGSRCLFWHGPAIRLAVKYVYSPQRPQARARPGKRRNDIALQQSDPKRLDSR